MKFAYASSSSVYGDALTLPTHEDDAAAALPYGVTKLAAEHLCVLYGVDTVALRYFSVYGPRQRPDTAFRRFCEAITSGEPIEIHGDGRQTRDFTYVVAGTRAAGETQAEPGRVFNICSGNRASLRRALEVLAGIAGRPLDVRYRERESGDVRDTGAETGRARSELGFSPATTLEQALPRS